MAPKVTVDIQYCGGWNYTPQFLEAQEFILGRFPKEVEVVGQMDKRPTGNFEIKINGVQVHSKRHLGHEFLVGNPPQEEVVISAISEILRR